MSPTGPSDEHHRNRNQQPTPPRTPLGQLAPGGRLGTVAVALALAARRRGTLAVERALAALVSRCGGPLCGWPRLLWAFLPSSVTQNSNEV